MNNNEILEKVIKGDDLTYDEAYEVLDNIMKGNLSESYVAGFLTALRIKGETTKEIAACAKAMRDNALIIEGEEDSLDIVGTGGDKAKTINISSIASFIIAACGVKVAKHGNRSVSSLCGAADCFESLGINIRTDKEKAKKLLDEENLCFLFAQIYHPAMKNVAPVRKGLGVRTIFNILGPLTNPCKAKNILLGVYDEKLLDVMADACLKMGMEKAVIVHGEDGLDEVTLTTTSRMTILKHGEIIHFTFDPHSYGFSLCKLSDLQGGTPEQNKEIALGILKNEIKGPKRDCVIINAAIAIYLMKDELSLDEAIKAADEALTSGKAYQKLLNYIEKSNK